MSENVSTEIKTPWGEIGYITFKRTYARRLDENDINSPTEEFDQVIRREIKACKEQLGFEFTEEEENFYFKSRMELKWSVAGRFMWQLGTKTVDKLGLPSLQNCAATVVDEPIKPFIWTFETLMLGVGVGFNIQRENVEKLPILKEKIRIERKEGNDVDFIVPDNREGWVKLLGKVLKAHFYSGEGFTYATHCVRDKGALIKGFGGVASGPEELVRGIGLIHDILNNRAGLKLRPIDCLDIMNIIGMIVVSGNVRRSAQLCIGDYDDIEYLQAKSWNLGSIPNWRAMSNNSVACDDTSKLPKEFWDTYEQGEPYGLINLRLSRLCGRLGEFQYSDPNVKIYNPCAEQSLEDKETCCLSEIFLPNITSYQELLAVLSLSYKVCKNSLALHCSLKDTEKIVHRNMRMGIGITGTLQATEKQRSWLKEAYVWLRQYDNRYSFANKFPPSIKLTTSKPSGTLSLLPGVTPGGNPNPAGPYYIRRIRVSSNSNLIEVCRNHGYHIESQINFDDSIDHTTMVISFPCKVPETTPVAATFSWKEQLATIKWLQENWSDNSVSCTVTYKREDLEEIKEYLIKNYSDNFKTLSFLLYKDHGFKQAPYETISKEQYEEMIKNVTPITSIEIKETDYDLKDCDNGACPIK